MMFNLLNRSQLSEVFKEHDTLRAFEQALSAVSITLPSTIEEANALAGAALAVAQAAVSAISTLAEAIAQLEGEPTPPPLVEQDDTAPRVHLGTISAQDADSVEITGGTIDGVPIGLTTAAAAKFTTVAASDQITSTVATGTAPFVIASTTKVTNLHADQADTLANPTSYPPAASDLATCITLANALRTANIAKGV